MRPRTILRIARWEVTKGVGTFDRGAAAVVIAALAFVLAVGLVVTVGGVALEDGIYRVGVDESSEFRDPIETDPTFTAVDPSPGAVIDSRLVADGQYDLVIEDRPRGTRIYLAESDGEPTEKSLAAVSALRNSIDRYNERQFRGAENATAAFPVIVSIDYVEQGGTEIVTPDERSAGVDRSEDRDAEMDESGAPADESPRGPTGSAPTGDDAGERIATPSLGSFDLFGTGGTAGTPSDIQPPFPFQSLVLAFLFVLPLNFLIQVYGSSMLGERLNRRGELLLVAPVDRSEIVLGKTLPYAFASVALTGGIVAVLWLLGAQAGVLSVLAVVPISLLFLATTFLGAMFVRSFKELTFVTVAITTVLTSYVFVPAIFTETSPVAFVSPLTLVVKDLTASAVSPGQFVFATGPPTLVAGICFLFGFGVYREEDLFTQRPVPYKALDALAARIDRPRSVGVVVVLLVPFVFLAELLAVVLLFALPVAVSIPLVFASVAVIEELAKGLPIYAGFVHGRYERTVWISAVVGAAAGVGFFLAEKLAFAVQLVGLSDSVVATAAFQTGIGANSPFVLALLVLAPLGLHVGTSMLTALGASRGRATFVVGLVAAILVHLAYNVAVVSRFV